MLENDQGDVVFRRRCIFRPFGRPSSPEIHPALQRANDLLANGDFLNATEVFEELPRGEGSRDGPRTTGLLIQAGRMRVLAGQVALGVVHIQLGLGLLAVKGQWQRFRNSCQRISAELAQLGSSDQTSQIEATLNSNRTTGNLPRQEQKNDKQVVPTNCPGFGGPLQTGEVEWSDETTAEYPYCGIALGAH
jgi:hypothetical protein